MQVKPRPIHQSRSVSRPTSENALQLRNYDDEGLAEVTVTVEARTGDTVYEDTYVVLPRMTWCVDLPVEPGVYRVSASVRSNTAATGSCRIGDDPTEFVSIETGNGVVTVVCDD